MINYLSGLYTQIGEANGGKYQGRHLITSDSRIQGGVFAFPGSGMEACVL